MTLADYSHLLDDTERGFLDMLSRFAAEEIAPHAAKTDESATFVHSQIAALASSAVT